MMSKNVGLLIGRFQPFHKGHLYLIKKALEQVDSLKIGIGSANVTDENNPYSFEERKKILETVAKTENIKNRIVSIIPINDHLQSDEIWYEKAKEVVGEFEVYVGNDEWNTGIFGGHGHRVLRFPFYKRYRYEGTKIRRLMIKGGKWKERVPPYLVQILNLKFRI